MNYLILEILDETHSVPAGLGRRYEDVYDAEEAMARMQKFHPTKKYKIVYDPE